MTNSLTDEQTDWKPKDPFGVASRGLKTVG